MGPHSYRATRGQQTIKFNVIAKGKDRKNLKLGIKRRRDCDLGRAVIFFLTYVLNGLRRTITEVHVNREEILAVS